MQAVEHRHDLVGKLRIILPVFHQPVLEPDEGLHIMHHIGAPVHLLDGGGQLDQVVGYLLFLQILVRSSMASLMMERIFCVTSSRVIP